MQKRPAPNETAPARVRILECWLPLAQDLNEYYEWGHDTPTLEALIMAVWPALALTPTPLAARAVLWRYRRRQVQASVNPPPATEDPRR